MDFLPENIQKYISDNSQSESLILNELNRYTNSKVILPRMLSGHVQGRFLSMISKLVNPETYRRSWNVHWLFMLMFGRGT